MFGEQPDPRLPRTPQKLGPRYRVDYRIVAPKAAVTIRQDLYPYAAGGVVTYMAPAQRFWGGQQTQGGWIRSPELAAGQETLRAALIRAGLPTSVADTGREADAPVAQWTRLVLFSIVGVAVLLALFRVRGQWHSPRFRGS